MQLQFELNFLKRSIRQGQKNTYFPKRKKNLKELQYPETIHCRNICLTNTFVLKLKTFTSENILEKCFYDNEGRKIKNT